MKNIHKFLKLKSYKQAKIAAELSSYLEKNNVRLSHGASKVSPQLFRLYMIGKVELHPKMVDFFHERFNLSKSFILDQKPFEVEIG